MFSIPYRTIASARGCSDFFSRDVIIPSISVSEDFPRFIMSVTLDFPSVRVPVLSKIIAFTLQAVSSGSHPFIRIPFDAPIPVPTIMAVGVASPSAQGQAMTITAAK